MIEAGHLSPALPAQRQERSANSSLWMDPFPTVGGGWGWVNRQTFKEAIGSRISHHDIKLTTRHFNLIRCALSHMTAKSMALSQAFAWFHCFQVGFVPFFGLLFFPAAGSYLPNFQQIHCYRMDSFRLFWTSGSLCGVRWVFAPVFWVS